MREKEPAPFSRRTVHRKAQLFLLAVFSLALFASLPAVHALPPGFEDTVVISSFPGAPVSVRFAADGKVFIGLKHGLIMQMNNIADPAPRQFADVNTEVDDTGDQGLLGLATHPQWPAQPYVYALYTVDMGATRGGRLVRWRYNFTTGMPVTGSKTVLLDQGWCFTDSDSPYGSHSIGDIQFGPDGALYVSAGEGANYDLPDVGDFAADLCPDPAGEGGALRSIDPFTPSDPTNLDGAILRLNPDTGLAMPNNPWASSPDANRARIIAYGLRNPFRFAIDQATGELWVGDNGWALQEEVNHIPNPVDSVVENFGWPCYEGTIRQPGYDSLDNPMCESLYAAGTATQPWLALQHSAPHYSFSSTGATIYTGTQFPPAYAGALFIADLAAGEFPEYGGGTDSDPDHTIRVIFRNASGQLDQSTLLAFNNNPLRRPTDIQTGPDGALYYPDFTGGTLRRIRYGGPIAIINASTLGGNTPLSVTFSGSGSYDVGGGAVTYAWDLDGNGVYNDGTTATVNRTYTSTGTILVGLRVTDTSGNTAVSSVTITAGAALVNQPPLATITAPSNAFRYAVGDLVTYAGTAYDPDGLTLPASALQWSLALNHCQPTDANNCHTHPLDVQNGVSGGSVLGPDHEFPSFISLQLVATELPWWNTAWDYRTRILLNATGVSQTVANLPVPVRLTPATFNYAHAGPNGRDLRFIGPANELLAYEIESWNATGESIIWVRAPLIDPALTVNGFWLYFGNAAATDAQTPATVWSENFLAMYHLTRSGNAVPDSRGTSSGVVVSSPTQTPGIIGPGLFFDGVGEYVNTQLTTNIANADWSIAAWEKLDTSLPCIDGPEGPVEGKNIVVKEWNHRMYLKESCKIGGVSLRLANDSTNAIYGMVDTQIFEVGTPEDRAWHHVVYQYRKNLNRTEVYFDGVLVGTNNTQTSMATNGAAFNIGGGGGAQKHFVGTLDDVSIATVARSASWILLSHRGGRGTLARLGTEQQRTQVGAPLSVAVTKNVHPYTVNLTFTTSPAGLQLTTFGRTLTTPFVYEMLQGGETVITAPASQVLGQTTYQYQSWSDGGARSHSVTAIPGSPARTAFYTSGNQSPVQLGASSSPTGASVSANGQFIGTTPLTASLPAGAYNVTFSLAGYTDFVTPVTLTTGQNSSVNAVLTPVDTSALSIRVNAGGLEYTDSSVHVWSNDTGFTGGYASTFGAAISGTTDDTLYQSERWTPDTVNGLQYNFAVPNGMYLVKLHFAEIYPGTFGNGLRIFNADIEGQQVLSNLDIFSEVGANAALVKSFNTTVSDGTLNIRLRHVVENPKIGAIEIVRITATTPAIALSTNAVTFAGTQINQTTAIQQVFVTNTGAAPLIIPSWTKTGPAAGDFIIGASTNYTLAPGASATINVLFVPSAAGTRTATVTINSNAPQGPVTIALSGVGIAPVVNTTTVRIKVNAGGPAYVDGLGNTWGADTGFAAGTNTGAFSSPIAGTTDDALYQTERWSPDTVNGLRYAFPVPDGNYEVALHFAEIYFGTFGNGLRVFDVELEGQPVLNDLDMFSEVGANAAIIKRFNVSVTDGQLNVQLRHDVENPKISAIEISSISTVLPPYTPLAIRVNSAGPAYTDPSGAVWAADSGFNVDTNTATAANAIASTTRDPLYQTERWAPNSGTGIQYGFAVPSGTYDVSLHFSENYAGTYGVGLRRFDVELEGVQVDNDLDVFQSVGANTALVRTHTVSVTDGTLNIRLRHVTENPMINAVEIVRVG